MSISEKLGIRSFQDWLDEFMGHEEAFLVDVRTEGEYRAGHVPGSINIPLDRLESINTIIHEYDVSVYVYCLSGFRSRRAQKLLEQMGFTDVHNIGAFSQYKGLIEH